MSLGFEWPTSIFFLWWGCSFPPPPAHLLLLRTPPAQTVVLGNPLAGFANRPCLLHSTTSGQSKAITLQNHWAFCLIQGLQKVMCHLFLRRHACACAHVTFVPQAAPCYRRGFCSIPVFVSVCLPQEWILRMTPSHLFSWEMMGALEKVKGTSSGHTGHRPGGEPLCPHCHATITPPSHHAGSPVQSTKAPSAPSWAWGLAAQAPWPPTLSCSSSPVISLWCLPPLVALPARDIWHSRHHRDFSGGSCGVRTALN